MTYVQQLWSSLVDGLNENAGAIQAVATVVLVAVTFGYARWVRKHVRQDREHFEEADRQRIDRAVQDIIIELLLNHMPDHDWQSPACPPLLNYAYVRSSWAIPLSGVSADTTVSIGSAYLTIEKYMAMFRVLMSHPLDTDSICYAKGAWDGAQAAIARALKTIQLDSVARGLIPEYRSLDGQEDQATQAEQR